MAEATTKKTVAKKAPKKVAKTATKKAATPKTKEGEFAVIETGGKQYIVEAGDTVEVELLGEYKEGGTVEFDKVLMTDDGKDATIGTPYIKGAKVIGTYQGEKKGKKLTIVRYKAKSNRHRKVGHRQRYAVVKIDSLA
jgi:large subunit ribosomal protein L21